MLDPRNHKATSTGEDAVGIDNELDAAHIEPASLVTGTDPGGRGEWIANLPFGVRIGQWFFSHAGNAQKLSIQDLQKALQRSLDQNGFGDNDITGKDSILEAQNW